MPNPNRPAVKKITKKMATTSSAAVAYKAMKKAAIIKYDINTAGSNHGQKMTKRANQGRVAAGEFPVPLYEAGDADFRRAEKAYMLQAKQFGSK
jgi:hypothetical protein